MGQYRAKVKVCTDGQLLVLSSLFSRVFSSRPEAKLELYTDLYVSRIWPKSSLNERAAERPDARAQHNQYHLQEGTPELCAWSRLC